MHLAAASEIACIAAFRGFDSLFASCLCHLAPSLFLAPGPRPPGCLEGQDSCAHSRCAAHFGSHLLGSVRSKGHIKPRPGCRTPRETPVRCTGCSTASAPEAVRPLSRRPSISEESEDVSLAASRPLNRGARAPRGRS